MSSISPAAYNQRQAYRIIQYQLWLIAGFASLIMAVGGIKHGLAVGAGGLAQALPTWLLVWRVFRFARPAQHLRFLQSFLLYEFIKLALSGFLILVIVKWLPVSLLFVLVGFSAAIVFFWLAGAYLLIRT